MGGTDWNPSTGFRFFGGGSGFRRLDAQFERQRETVAARWRVIPCSATQTHGDFYNRRKAMHCTGQAKKPRIKYQQWIVFVPDQHALARIARDIDVSSLSVRMSAVRRVVVLCDFVSKRTQISSKFLHLLIRALFQLQPHSRYTNYTANPVSGRR